MKYCPFCGSKLEDSMAFCPDCGKRFVTAETISEVSGLASNIETTSEGQNAVAGVPQKEKKRRKLFRGKRKWVIPACIILAVALLGAVYYAPYQYAKRGNFSSAGKLIVIPSIYDSNLVNYVIAGLTLEAGDYKLAEELFRELPADYLDRPAMVSESMYQRALLEAESHSYEEALDIMKRVSDVGYRDSAEQCNAIRYDAAHYYLDEKNDALKAYIMMKAASDDGYSRAQDEIVMLRDKLYIELQNYYRRGLYSSVISRCKALGDYKDCDKYDLLANFKSSRLYSDYGDTYTYGKAVTKLLSMSHFEDSLSVLVLNQNFAEAYLKGTWKTENGNHYFKIDSNGDASYNLPRIDSSKKYYTIQNGEYIQYKDYSTENDAIKQFKIAPVSEKLVMIYCQKNQKYYMLYKQ